MKEFTHKIKAENGLHARPAGALATCAKGFKSQIKVKKDEKEADAKRLLSLMSLGAVCGASLSFEIDGEDESEACEALSAFCKENL